MKNILNHFFGRFQNNEHEEREIFETMNAPPENVTERIVEALKTEGQHEKAADLLEEHSDNPGILDQVKNQLETLKGSETEKQVITENFRNMQRQAAENQRERLKNAVETLQVNTETKENPSDERADTEKETNEKTLAKNDASLEESRVIPTDVAANVTEEDKRWLPRTPDPRKWTEKQIATVATVTVGAIGLYALYRWFRNRDTNDSNQTTPEKKTWLKKLAWIPAVGLAIVGGYFGHQWMKKFSWYKNATDNVVEWGKNAKEHIPFMGPKEGEKYGLDEIQYAEAEESYRTARKDTDVIRNIFGLKQGETNEKHQKFLEAMESKYETKVENGITYARAEVALKNYEETVKVGLDVLEQWIENHVVELGIAAYALHRTGLLRIQSIIRGGASIASKSASVAKELAKMTIKHPIISFFTIGGSILGMKAAIAAGKKLYLPENFGELGKAFENETAVALGEASEIVNKQAAALKEDAVMVADISANAGVWMTEKMADFAKTVFRESPEMFGRTEEENMETRIVASIENLERWLENKKITEGTSSESIANKVPAKIETAQRLLADFKSSLLENRIRQTNDSKDPEQKLTALKEALSAIGVEILIENGIVRWKFGEGISDLSVDPGIKEKDAIKVLSERMREGDESYLGYVFFRGIQHLREKEQEGMERASFLTDNKVAAMIVGNFIYITSWENDWEYFTMPLHLAKDLLPTSDRSWEEYLATAGEGAVGATLMKLNASAITKIKRTLIGGGPILRKDWKTVGGILNNINPVTSPIKLVRDMARGVIDFETFASLGHFKEYGGRYINKFLGTARIRPEWIGVIEHSDDIKALQRVAGEVGKGHFMNMEKEVLRNSLRDAVMKSLKETKLSDLYQSGKTVEALNYDDVYKAASDWYATRSRMSKYAEKVSSSIEELSNFRGKTFASIRKRLPGSRANQKGSVTKTIDAADDTIAEKIGPEIAEETPPSLKKAAGAEGMTEVVPEKKPELKLFKGEEASDEMIESVSRIASEDELVKEIAAAKNAKNEAKLVELLKHPMLEQAAKSSDEEVRAIAKAANWAKRFAQSKGMRITGKVIGKGLLALGPAIDTYLIYDNQNQLNDAIEKNDTAAIERLKARQKSLEAAGMGGLLSLGLSFGPGILVGGAVMAGTMYTEAVYESIAEWEKTQEDYKHEDSALLLSKINQKVGEYSWGHSAGIGDTGIVRLWKKLTYSKDAYEKDVAGKHEEMAENNEGQRREMYAAYFLKNSFMPPLAGENSETYKNRVKEHVRHRMTFIEAMTEKTMGAVSSDTLGYSESYAELREIKARLEAEGNPALLSYEWNGEQKELDLTNLEAMSMPELISLVPRYHNEVKPLQLLEKWAMLEGIMKDSGQNASEVIRADVFNRLRDTINKAEMKIRTTNMNGLMDESEQNTVRLVLKDRLESEVTRIAASVMNESLDAEGLNQALQNIVATIDSIANNAQKTYDEAPDTLKNKAYDEADAMALLALAPNMGA